MTGGSVIRRASFPGSPLLPAFETKQGRVGSSARSRRLVSLLQRKGTEFEDAGVLDRAHHLVRHPIFGYCCDFEYCLHASSKERPKVLYDFVAYIPTTGSLFEWIGARGGASSGHGARQGQI